MQITEHIHMPRARTGKRRGVTAVGEKNRGPGTGGTEHRPRWDTRLRQKRVRPVF